MVVFYPTLSYLSSKNLTYAIIFLIGEIMKPLKEKISITIDSDLLKDLKNEAEKDDRSLSQFINLILRKFIKETKED